MPFLAGEVVTAARLLMDSDFALLATTDTGTVFADWGAETVTFSNPGTAVKVTAFVTGQASHSATADIFVQPRVGISFDGGSVFTFGNEPASQTAEATGAAQRQNVAASHHRSGTPTGNVVIKAQARESSSTTNTMFSGMLVAFIHAT